MGAFFIRYRWLTVALLVVVAFAVVFGIWSRWITADPLDASLSLSPPGRVETDVFVRLSCPHRLRLHLSSKTRAREDMRRLVGQYGTAEGIDIPLQWSFRDMAGQPVAWGKAENIGGDGFDAEGFYRAVSTSLPLPPGKYRLSAALTEEMVEFQDVSAQISFRCHPKASAGWQTDLLFFGSFAWLLAWPIMAILALWLAALALRDRGRARAVR